MRMIRLRHWFSVSPKSQARSIHQQALRRSCLNSKNSRRAALLAVNVTGLFSLPTANPQPLNTPRYPKEQCYLHQSSLDHIGGIRPFLPTATKLASRAPLDFDAMINTFSPGDNIDCSAGTKRTTGALGGTITWTFWPL